MYGKIIYPASGKINRGSGIVLEIYTKFAAFSAVVPPCTAAKRERAETHGVPQVPALTTGENFVKFRRGQRSTARWTALTISHTAVGSRDRAITRAISSEHRRLLRFLIGSFSSCFQRFAGLPALFRSLLLRRGGPAPSRSPPILLFSRRAPPPLSACERQVL